MVARSGGFTLFVAFYVFVITDAKVGPLIDPKAAPVAAQSDSSKLVVRNSSAPVVAAVDGTSGSSLRLVDVLVAKADSMENGVAKLSHDLKSAMHQAMYVDNKTEAKSMLKGQTEQAKQILSELRNLRLLAGQVRGHVFNEVGELKALVNRQQTQLEVEVSRGSILRRERSSLQKTVEAGLTSVRHCAEQLREAQLNASEPRKACAAVRRKDVEEAARLKQELRSVQFELHRTSVNCAANASALEREKANASSLRSQITTLSGKESALLNNTQKLQQKIASVNSTEQTYQQQIENLNEKLDLAKEHSDDEAEVAHDLKSANDVLRQDADADKQAIATLQRDLDAVTRDKEQLLESVRALMKENSKLQEQLAQVVDVPAPNSSEVVRPPNAAPSGEFSKDGSRQHAVGKNDPVAWLGTTDAIDGYLNQLTPEQLASSASTAAGRQQKAAAVAAVAVARKAPVRHLRSGGKQSSRR